MTEIPEGMKALVTAVEAAMWGRPGNLSQGEALLAPDGPLWPALRALGRCAINECIEMGEPRDAASVLASLAGFGITGPLADACLAAAEVKP